MSYQALARKYRPQSFAEVAGQQHALNSLVHALETQKFTMPTYLRVRVGLVRQHLVDS